MADDFISRLKGIKGIGVIAVVFVVGLILVLMTSGESAVPEEKSEFDAARYTRELETELCEIIGHINGVGATHVMVTLESTDEQYYQKNIKSRSDINSAEREESVVFEDKSPILIKKIMPEIKGVAVVCDGAVSAQVMQKVIELVACTLNLPAHRIYVTY